jgi:hypothetical protein
MNMQTNTFQTVLQAEEQGTLCLRAAYDCFISGDKKALQAAFDHWRMINSQIQKIQAGLSPYRPKDFYNAYHDYQPKEEISGEMLAIFAVKWLNRLKDAGHEAFNDINDEVIEAFLDGKLPSAWDKQYDLLLVLGFSESLENHLIRGGHKRVIFIDKTLPADFAGATDDFIYLREAELLSHCFLARHRSVQVIATKPEISDATKKKCLDLAVNNYSTVSTLMEFSEAWLENSLANLPAALIGKNIFTSENIFTGRDVILASPGPSLQNDIDVLYHHQETKIICAVSWACRTLVEHKIYPDFVLVADSSLSAEDLFSGVDLSKTCLIASTAIQPDILALPFKDVIYIETSDFIVRNHYLMTGRKAHDFGAGSSSIIGLRVFAEQGANSVALVGNDLAVKGDQIYADKTFVTEGQKELLKRKIREEIVYADAIGGGTVTTKHNYNLFILQTSQLASLYQEQNIRTSLFNCTSYGAYIEGFEHIPLADYLVKTDGLTAKSGIIAETYAAIERQSECLSYAEMPYQKIIDEVADCIKMMSRLNKKAKKLATLSEQQYDQFMQQEEAIFDRIEKQAVINMMAAESSEKIMLSDFENASDADRARLAFYKKLTELMEKYLRLIKRFDKQLSSLRAA